MVHERGAPGLSGRLAHLTQEELDHLPVIVALFTEAGERRGGRDEIGWRERDHGVILTALGLSNGRASRPIPIAFNPLTMRAVSPGSTMCWRTGFGCGCARGSGPSVTLAKGDAATFRTATVVLSPCAVTSNAGDSTVERSPPG